jgi:hypothetical protein
MHLRGVHFLKKYYINNITRRKYMIKLNNILDHKVMMDRLNEIVTDGVQKNQTRDDVLVEVLKVVIALEHGQEALEDDMEREILNLQRFNAPKRWNDIPVDPNSQEII